MNDNINKTTLYGIEGNIIMTLRGHTSPVVNMNFSKNRIVTISAKSQAIAWVFDPEKIRKMNRGL